MNFALVCVLAAACAGIATGQPGLGARRALTQQTPSEVIYTGQNVSRLEEIIQDLTPGSVLVLAVNRIQVDAPLALDVPLTVKGMSTDATTVVTCSGNGISAFEISTDGVILEDLTIQECGAPAVRLERPSGADGQPWKSTLNRVRFQSNGDLQNFGVFLPTGAILAGGAIGAGDGFALTVNDCYFGGNVGTSGAGISVDGSSLSVVNSTFEDNTVEGATFSGGAAISVTNTLSPRVVGVSASIVSCSFVGNKDLTGGFDPNALTLINGAPLERAEFTAFQTPQPSGGAVFAYRIQSLEILDSVFSENSAAPAGGAVFSRSVSDVEISGCSFSNNRAHVAGGERQSKGRCPQGGALYAEVRGARSTFLVKETTFEGNSAMCGGAVHLVGATEASVKLDQCAFDGNFAKAGGALLLRNVFAPVVTRTRFRANAAVSGGAVLLTNEAGLVATAFEGDAASKFEGNLAVDGGAIAMVGGGVVTLESMPFVGNHALHYGGAVASIVGSVNTVILVENARMVNNTAARGGALFLDSVDSVSFLPTSRQKVNVFRGNVAQQGGAIYYHAESRMNNGLRLQTTDFIENVAVVTFADPVESTPAFSAVVDDRTRSIDKLREVLLVVGTPVSAVPDETHTALNGGGGGVFLALENVPRRGSVEVKLQDATFQRNAARIGGGLLVSMADGKWEPNCDNADDIISGSRGNACRSVLLVNPKFSENTARTTGGAVAATHPDNIFVEVKAGQDPVRLTSVDALEGVFMGNEGGPVLTANDVGTVQI